MRIRISLFFALLAFVCQSQYRIAADFTTAIDNAYLSLLYCPVFHQHYYVKTGFSAGGYGYGEVFEGKVFAGMPMKAPYAQMEQHPEKPTLSLVHYTSRNRGYGFEIGAGRFWELGPVHTIRVDLQLKAYRIHETMRAAFMEHPDDTIAYYYHYAFDRNCFSVGPEIFHAIRFSARFTVYYGVKLPYFLPLRMKNYRPQNHRDLTVGMQPHLALGISYAVQQKKRAKQQQE